MYIFTFHIVKIAERVPFVLQNKPDYKCDIDFTQQVNKHTLLLRYLRFRHHIACFCSISQTKKLSQTATALFCVSEQHDGDSFLNLNLSCYCNSPCSIYDIKW